MNQNKEAIKTYHETLFHCLAFFFLFKMNIKILYQQNQPTWTVACFIFNVVSAFKNGHFGKSGNGIFQFSLASVGTLKEAGTSDGVISDGGCWVMLGLEGFC